MSTAEPPLAEPAAPAGLRPPRGELISSASALALLVLMFAMKWYGVAGVPGVATTRAANPSSENAWDALTQLRWLMLVTIIVGLGSAVLRFTQRGHGTQSDTSLLITALGALTAAFVTYRVLIDLPAPSQVLDQKLGGVLGVFAAMGIALGGFDSLREERARARRLLQASRTRPGVAVRARAR